VLASLRFTTTELGYRVTDGCGVYSWVVKEAGSMVRPLPTTSLTVIENRKSSISMRACGLIWSPSLVLSSEIGSGREILLETLTSGD